MGTKNNIVVGRAPVRAVTLVPTLYRRARAESRACIFPLGGKWYFFFFFHLRSALRILYLNKYVIYGRYLFPVMNFASNNRARARNSIIITLYVRNTRIIRARRPFYVHLELALIIASPASLHDDHVE